MRARWQFASAIDYHRHHFRGQVTEGTLPILATHFNQYTPAVNPALQRAELCATKRAAGKVSQHNHVKVIQRCSDSWHGAGIQ